MISPVNQRDFGHDRFDETGDGITPVLLANGAERRQMEWRTES